MGGAVSCTSLSAKDVIALLPAAEREWVAKVARIAEGLKLDAARRPLARAPLTLKDQDNLIQVLHYGIPDSLGAGEWGLDMTGGT